jgi:molybdenum cofactor synthesis domain-containing protein
MIKKIKSEEAIGMTLAHDLTKIVPGKFKGPLFRKGHVILKEDVEELLKIGKDHIYILQLEEGEVHEDDAALRLAKVITGQGLTQIGPREAKINLKTEHKGLVKVNVNLLEQINAIGEIIVSTVHHNTICQSGTIVAGLRVIPLVIQENKIKKVEDLCLKQGKVIHIVPLLEKRVGIIVVGTEVYKGRIKDSFTEIIERKVSELDSVVIYRTVVPDDIDSIAQAIKKATGNGVEVVIACGGMSVDPDDVTREGILKAGASIIFYGVPVLPGSMTLYATLEGIPVIGVPACVLHDPTTAFDIFLPRLLAGDDLSLNEIAKLGHGGLCLSCPECNYPVCPFGK